MGARALPALSRPQEPWKQLLAALADEGPSRSPTGTPDRRKGLGTTQLDPRVECDLKGLAGTGLETAFPSNAMKSGINAART